MEANSERLGGCRRAACLAHFALFSPELAVKLYGPILGVTSGHAWRHCESPGCHEFYWSGGAGADSALAKCKPCQSRHDAGEGPATRQGDAESAQELAG